MTSIALLGIPLNANSSHMVGCAAGLSEEEHAHRGVKAVLMWLA